MSSSSISGPVRANFRIGLLAGTLLATGWSAEAQAQSNVPPPAQITRDENGVTLSGSGGQVQMPSQQLSIGPADDPLVFVDYGNLGWAMHNLHFDLFSNSSQSFTPSGTLVTSTDVTASVDGGGASRAELFHSTDPAPLTSSLSDGAAISKVGAVYSVILRDGTKYTYGNTDITSSDALYSAGWAGRVTEIMSPNGQKLTFFYKKVTYTCPNNSCAISISSQETKVRLQSVTRSDGYQMHFNYVSNLTATLQQEADWDKISIVVAFNDTSEYCNPNSDACSLINQWPSLNYQRDLVNGTTVVSVTGPAGVAKYWGGSTSTSVTSYYQSPGASAANFSMTTNFSDNSKDIVNNGLSWHYQFISEPVDPNTYPIQYRNRIVRTGPEGKTFTVIKGPGQTLPTTVTDEENNTWSFSYGVGSRLEQAVSPEGRATTYTYDTRGNVTTVTNVAKPGSGLANIVTTANFASTCTNALTCNKPIWTKDALGNQTDYTYDGTHGGVLTVTAPADAAGVRPQVRYTYTSLQAYFKNSAGSIVASGVPTYRITGTSSCLSATSANPASCVGTAAESKTTVSFGPQTAGTANNLLPISGTQASGDGSLSATIASTYDSIGNQTSRDGPLAGTADTTVYRYDAARRVVGVVGPDPDGAGTRTPTAQRITFNPDSQVTLAEAGTVTDQSNTAWTNFSSQQQVANTYDANGRLVQTKVTAGGNTYSLTQQNYDTTGRVKCRAQRMDPAQWTAQSDACVPQTTGTNGPDRVTQTAYDGLNRVTTTTVGVGTADAAVSQTSTYTADGELASVKDGDANLTTYEYDGFDRAAKTRFPVSTAGANISSTTDYEQLTYDGNSRVSQRRLRDGATITFAYDNLNRVTTRTPSGEAAATFQYDLAGNVIQMSNGLAVTMAYDGLGRQLNEMQPYGSASYQYDSAGRRTRLTWSDGLYATYDYDVVGNVTAIRENGAASGVGVLATYTYDNLGRRTGITRGNGTSTSNAFDPVSRLTSTTQDLAGTASDQTIGSITYNPASQIQSQVKSNDAYAWTGHYNVNRGYTVNGLNQQTAAGATALGYDGRGNLTTSGANTYTYDNLNELIGGPGTTLTYDPSGRLSQIVGASGTTRFANAGSAMVQETSTTGTILRRYVPGPGTDEPVVWYEGSGTADRRWLHTDERGSVIGVSDGSGAMLNLNRYDEYGIPQATNVGRFQYTGQAWLPELGMYYYKARMYSPTLGRFMQTDPTGYGDGLNWYNYVGSDPIGRTDPTGLDAQMGSPPAPPADLTHTFYGTPDALDLGSASFSGGPGGGTGADSLNLSAVSISLFSAAAAGESQNKTGEYILGGLDVTVDEIHDVAAKMAKSKVTKLILKGEGHIIALPVFLITYNQLRKEGFSKQASIAGAIAATGASMGISTIGSWVGGIGGGIVDPLGGELPGAVGGSVAATGLDVYFEWSLNAGRSAANVWGK